MLNNTRRIYERLNKGEFLSADSSDISTRHLYDDVEENFEDYSDFSNRLVCKWKEVTATSTSRV